MEMNWVGEGVGEVSLRRHTGLLLPVGCYVCQLCTGCRKLPSHSQATSLQDNSANIVGSSSGHACGPPPPTHTHTLLRLCSRCANGGQSTHDTNLG